MLKKRFRDPREIDSVVDIERLWSGPAKSLEKDPARFLALTFPTTEVLQVLAALERRFHPDSPDLQGTGLVVAEAQKGLGKSHLLLLAHHLFTKPDVARAWLQRIGKPAAIPEGCLVVTTKFTDERLPFDSLWTHIGEKIGARWPAGERPTLGEFRSALQERRLVLVFDELERGIQCISNEAQREKNLAFLQMISEEANRSSSVMLFASVYDGDREPGATLKRVPRIELRFRSPDDRAAIVRHRLIENAESYDREAADALIRSYANTWSRVGTPVNEEYIDRMRASFPFLPELIELVFARISAMGGFQGTRGALGLVAAMLNTTGEDAFLLTAAHARVTDGPCADRLQDLDPSGALIRLAQVQCRDLGDSVLVDGIASAVLLGSLARPHLDREELIRHVMTPAVDPNEFESVLRRLEDFGGHFFHREGRYYFDTEENENAKVNAAAARRADTEAAEEIRRVWLGDVFRYPSRTVVVSEIESAKESLRTLPRTGLRFCLSSRSLSAEERHKLYFGEETRNQILLFEPRDRGVHLLRDPDLLVCARRVLAAMELAESAGSAERRTKYERIAERERDRIRGAIRNAGLLYIRVDRWSESPSECRFEAEPMAQATSQEEALRYLRESTFPTALLAEHLQEHLGEVWDQRVREIEQRYRITLGYPVPLSDTNVAEAVRRLVEKQARIAGLQHPRGNFCGEHVSLDAGDLADATLTRPWPASGGPLFQQDGSGPLSAVPASEVAEGENPTAGPARRWLEVRTPYCRSLTELRQAVAEQLDRNRATSVKGMTFEIVARREGADVAQFPASLRGSIRTAAELEVQMTVRFETDCGKAEAEARCEALPSLPEAQYNARMTIPAEEPEAAHA